MKRVEGLEGIRGYMAVWVWLTHVTTMASLVFDKHAGWGRVLANGEIAVGTFIVISGFVISMNIARSPDSYIAYITRRAFRLFPVYLICLLVAVAILGFSISLMQDIPWAGPRTADRIRYLTDSRDYFWYHLPLHALLLHGLIPDSVLPSTSLAFIGQAWSLTLEWQFYLVAPVLFIVASKLRIRMLGICIVMILLLLLSKVFQQASFLPSSLFLFFIGFVSYRIYSQNEQEQAISPVSVGLILAAMSLLSLSRGGVGLGALVWSILFFSLFFSTGNIHRIIKASLTNPVANWLGIVSYSFYCVHMIVIMLTAGLLIYVLKIESRTVYATLLIGLSLPLSLFAAWLLNVFVENPMIVAGRNLVRQRALSRAAI